MFQVNFIMICLIQKILALLKITIILKWFLRTITELHLKKTNYFFSQNIVMETQNLKKKT